MLLFNNTSINSVIFIYKYLQTIQNAFRHWSSATCRQAHETSWKWLCLVTEDATRGRFDVEIVKSDWFCSLGPMEWTTLGYSHFIIKCIFTLTTSSQPEPKSKFDKSSTFRQLIIQFRVVHRSLIEWLPKRYFIKATAEQMITNLLCQNQPTTMISIKLVMDN